MGGVLARIRKIAGQARIIPPSLILLSVWIAVQANALTVTVPDQYATIQEALDSGADDIVVRPGTYLETPTITYLPLRDQDYDLSIRGLVAPGAPPDSLPVIAGLIFDDLTGFYVHTPTITLEDLRFSRVVENTFDSNPYSNPLEISFLRCVLDSGFDDSRATIGGQLEYKLRGCTIDGPSTFRQADRVTFDSSVVRQPITVCGCPPRYGVSWFTLTDSHVSGSGLVGVDVYRAENAIVTGNTFEGYEIPVQVNQAYLELVSNTFRGPGRYAVNAVDIEGDVVGNVVSGYEIGIRNASDGRPQGDWRISDNRAEGCTVAGVDVAAEFITLSRNTVLSCGAGAIVSATERATVAGNTILSCSGSGLVVRAGDAQIGANVVGRCGGDGIVATMDAARVSGAQDRLRGNTSYLNGGSGYSLTFLGLNPLGVIDHNIGYRNEGHGLEVVTNGAPGIACNDWFANADGAVQGMQPGTTDLAVDPLFCDSSQDDVHLAADSPLVTSAGCGLIGALGAGCDSLTTAVLMREFSAWRGTDGGIVLGRNVSGEPGTQVRIERADEPQGPWIRVSGTPESDGLRVTLVDYQAEPERAHWYRLMHGSDGTVLAVTFIAAAVQRGRFALEPASGNPGRGPFAIRMLVPMPAIVDVGIFDLQGRRIPRLASGMWPAGSHVLEWSGHDAAGRRPAGVLLVLYRFPGGQATRRLVLVR